jgi:putative DNA primase/helicase
VARVNLGGGFALSDQGLADGFNASDWKYIAPMKRWMHWNGRWWEADETNAIGAAVSAHLRATGSQSLNRRNIVPLNSTATERAVVAKIAERRDIACTSDGWDGDLMLFNTPECTFDLRDGSKHDHDREDMITNIATTSVGGDDQFWSRFVHKVMGGDEQKIAYLQRVAGYCATGQTNEHALFLLYGEGQNGKTTFVEALLTAMGTYGCVGPPDMLIAQTNPQHPTDVAGLYGKRFVPNDETEEGAAWSERKIKSLTGGGRTKARLMRKDFFEFTPQFKLMIQSNHKPRLTNAGKAMSRRVHLIPFIVQVPDNEVDRELGSKIRANIGAVVRWIIQGAVEWKRIGLQPPTSIVQATGDYFEEEDTISQWMDDCVAGGSAAGPELGKRTGTTIAYTSYSRWAQQQRRQPRANVSFLAALRDKAFEVLRSNGQRLVQGMELRSDDLLF